MKFHKFFILIAAALGGYAFYKARLSMTEPGTSSTPGQNFYSSITGPGSIVETYKAANDVRTGSSHTWGDTKETVGHQKPYPYKATGGIGASKPVEEETINNDLALIDAAAKNDKAKVEERLADQARVDSRDALRRTPLMYASWNGYEDICTRLLAAGANPEFKDRDGNNAFDYAAGRGLMDTLNYLLTSTHTTDDQHYVEYTKLIQAVFAGDVSKLPEGTGMLASVNRINPEGQAPLHIAAGNGSIDLMAALIKRGADVNLANNNRQVPLLWAAWNNQAGAVELLIKNGADMSKTDLGGNTPLIMAVQNNAIDAAKVLIKHGADKSVSNKEGKNALIIAEDKGLGELTDLLK